MTTHYTAVIKIHKTDTLQETVDRYGTVSVKAQRNTAEILSIVLQAPTITGLKKKLNGHIALVEETD